MDYIVCLFLTIIILPLGIFLFKEINKHKIRKKDHIMIPKSTKKVFCKFNKKKEIEQIESMLIEHKKRYVKKVKSLPERPQRLLGQNGFHLLQLALYRSWYLVKGSVDSIMYKTPGIAFLTTRAHFEVSGMLGFFSHKLNKFYEKKMNFKELDDILKRLTFGSRNLCVEEYEKAFNILTYIDTTDKLIKKYIESESAEFRIRYDGLSEYCHPNFNALSMGGDPYKVLSHKTMIYPIPFKLSFEDFKFLGDLLISIKTFFLFYDEIFKLLDNNEEFPIMIK
jgi:hypothetical protein